MLFDCFTFYNELELLEIRLNCLDTFVDKFVLVESTKTFTNKDKELYFDNNKAKYSKFLNKIGGTSRCFFDFLLLICYNFFVSNI